MLPTAPTLVRITGREVAEVRRLLGGMVRDRGSPRERKILRELRLPAGLGELRPAHRKFLKARGFDPDEVEDRWGVRGIGELGGRYAWRLFIPIYLGAQLVSWTTRAVGAGDPRRYDTAPEGWEAFPAKQLLYGEEKCGASVMLVEGPLDVWAVGPGAVCSFGAAVGKAQLARLARFPVRYVCLDAEEDAQRVARKLVRQLQAFAGDTYNVILETGKDASRCDKSELTRLKELLT